MIHRIQEWLGWFLLGFCVIATGGAERCLAQEPEQIAQIKDRWDRLNRQAEELKQAGKFDAAERVLAEAADLGAVLERRQEEGAGRRQELLAQVERAVGALRQLGRPEDAEQLARTLQSIAQTEQEGERREDAEHPEMRAARQQLEVMHLAMEALASADRGDAANQLERAMEALRLRIEGRRDEEAQAARRSAPDRGAQAELLAMASRILQERGQPDRAHVVGELAARLAGREAPPREEVQREARERREVRERPGAEQRLETLEERLREVTNAIEQLHAELRELRQER